MQFSNLQDLYLFILIIGVSSILIIILISFFITTKIDNNKKVEHFENKGKFIFIDKFTGEQEIFSSADGFDYIFEDGNQLYVFVNKEKHIFYPFDKCIIMKPKNI